MGGSMCHTAQWS